MRTFSADPVGAGVHELAEGPVWDEAAQLVRWVDIHAAAVYAGRLHDGALEVVAQLVVEASPTVGCVVPTADGGLLIAGRHGLFAVTGDGPPVPGPVILDPTVDARLNDGAVDPQGRFLVGSMALDSRRGEDRLYRVEPDGSVITLRTGLSLSNGLGWSPDGGTLYHVDSIATAVTAFPYPPAGDRLGEGVVLTRGGPGLPDGLCVDAEGSVWVAWWGTGEVRRYAPSGEQTACVRMPVPQPSSVAFVGARRDLLLVTTAWEDLGPTERAAAPDSGRLFACDVGVTGLPGTPWAGSGPAETTSEGSAR